MSAHQARLMKRGDIVRYWFDTGAFGCTILNGIVETAGPRAYTVRWESDLTNRIRQGDNNVTLETQPDLLVNALKKFRALPPKERP